MTMPFNHPYFRYEVFFKLFPVSDITQYRLVLHDFMNPEERKSNFNKSIYYVFKATPLKNYISPLMIKRKPLYLHLPKKSFDIAIAQELYKYSDDFKDINKLFDVKIDFRRTGIKVIIIDNLEVLEVKIKPQNE